MTFLLFIKAKEVIAPGNCLLLICEGKNILVIRGRENIVILVGRLMQWFYPNFPEIKHESRIVIFFRQNDLGTYTYSIVLGWMLSLSLFDKNSLKSIFLQEKSLSIQLKKDSVEITEIYFHSFMAKISWK